MANTNNSWAVLLAFALLATLAGCGKSDADGSATAEKGDAKATATAAIPGPTAPAADALHPVVLIETNLGAITVRLNAEKAQLTVANFLSYVDKGFYNQTIFHQVFKGQGVLGGGYGVDLAEKPPTDPEIYNEAHNGLKNRRGTIAMARTADTINSARSQFIFNVADNDALDFRDRTPEGYGYCVFGDVTAGLDVLDRIAAAPVHDTPQLDSTPVQPIVIKSIRRSK